MRTDEIRTRFLKFFEAHDHRIVRSAGLAPLQDPTLLFTGAGMNQFKDLFLGNRKDIKRAASCQKCLRTPDLEQVGRTPGHHTFFEMLGNFSFGDYFKEEAICWGWEFLTRDLKIPEGRLSVSVYTGDDEAYEVWHRKVGLEKNKIRRLGSHENFWPANAKEEGPDGPCGPCSEIFFDDVEVWNLVFTQFDRRTDGTLAPLPQKNIDTGMGLERLAACMQGKRSNFEIDIFEPVVARVRSGLGVRGKKEAARHLYAISDHARAVTFAVAEGINPSNEERGYVIRKLIRLALTHAWCVTGKLVPFLWREVIPEVVRVMQAAYPELKREREHIQVVVKEDEENFARIWSEGERRWADERSRLKKKKGASVRPEFVFKLHDTYGFPVEASRLLAERFGLKLNLDKVDVLLGAQRERSRKGTQISEAIFSAGENKGKGFTTQFLGYETARAEGRVTALFSERDLAVKTLGAGKHGHVILDKTPFYGEQGGQIGDRGTLKGPDGSLFEVEDTQYAGSSIVHIGRLKKGTLKTGGQVVAEVDDARRWHIRRNHTATHLLHSALRQVLGKGVRQSGSLVSDVKLRFDFTYSHAVSPRDLERIEELVNQKILENHEVATREMNYNAALKAGAIAFFGDKYGSRVRVVGVAGFSKEFCGGTHCRRTGDIGIFRITSENSVAQGMRRIEAVTGWGSIRKMQADEERARGVAAQLKTSPERSLERAREITRQLKGLEKEVNRLKTGGGSSAVETLIQNACKVRDITLVVGTLEGYKQSDLRGISDRIRERTKRCVILLGSVDGGKAAIVVTVTRDLEGTKLDASRLASDLAKTLGGSGGGRRDFAQAGGRDSGKLDAALKRGQDLVQKQLG